MASFRTILRNILVDSDMVGGLCLLPKVKLDWECLGVAVGVEGGMLRS
jgi:hypothetical protein